MFSNLITLLNKRTEKTDPINIMTGPFQKAYIHNFVSNTAAWLLYKKGIRKYPPIAINGTMITIGNVTAVYLLVLNINRIGNVR